MKSLKGRFIRTYVLMALISAILILLVTFIVLVIFSISEPDGFGKIIEGVKVTLAGSRSDPDHISTYMIIWSLLVCVAVLATCIILSIYVSRQVLDPIKELRKAAENINDGNLDFEVFTCEDYELNDLCVTFEEIRKRLKANAIIELSADEERGRLVANISHDLRTPITTIKGYIEGIQDGVADTEEKRQRYLDTIYSKALVLERLVDSMTEYSELELGKMQYVFEYVDLTEFVSDIMQDYKIDIEEKGMKLETTIYAKPLLIVADRGKLKRVFDNLISNAIKYSENKGTIKVRTETEGKGALASISDTGIGIPDKDIQNIFFEFYRGDVARSNIKGHGLGLAISKEIVESHHGKIWVRSRENEGTDIFIYLPLRVI